MYYRISEIARKCNINKETIRYYERKGVIPKPKRTDVGYRMYTEETVGRIKFIKHMQELGFTLAEIDKLLGIVDKDSDRCTDMYQFIVQKIEEVQSKIQDLIRIEKMLQQLRECCPNEENLYSCPVVEVLFEE